MELTSTIEWHDTRKELPQKDGYYLIAWKSPFDESDDPPVIIAKCFVTDLSTLSDISFKGQDRPGFWDAWGDHEYIEEDLSCIRYWAEMPEIIIGNKEEIQNGRYCRY